MIARSDFTDEEFEDSLSIQELAGVLNLSYVQLCKYFQHGLIPFIGNNLRRRVRTETKDILVDLIDKHGEHWFHHLPWPNIHNIKLGSCAPKIRRGPRTTSPQSENMMEKYPDSIPTPPVQMPLKAQETPKLSSSIHLVKDQPVAENTSAMMIYKKAKELHAAGKYEVASHLFMLVGELSD